MTHLHCFWHAESRHPLITDQASLAEASKATPPTVLYQTSNKAASNKADKGFTAGPVSPTSLSYMFQPFNKPSSPEGE